MDKLTIESLSSFKKTALTCIVIYRNILSFGMFLVRSILELLSAIGKALYYRVSAISGASGKSRKVKELGCT